jgi:hypothetical protein
MNGLRHSYNKSLLGSIRRSPLQLLAQVNKLLSGLGYQEKIQGQWSATKKAIAANLCDRKPVDTNSRTQKDQLLWSADIALVLKEHILEVEK